MQLLGTQGTATPTLVPHYEHIRLPKAEIASAIPTQEEVREEPSGAVSNNNNVEENISNVSEHPDEETPTITSITSKLCSQQDPLKVKPGKVAGLVNCAGGDSRILIFGHGFGTNPTETAFGKGTSLCYGQVRIEKVKGSNLEIISCKMKPSFKRGDVVDNVVFTNEEGKSTKPFVVGFALEPTLLALFSAECLHAQSEFGDLQGCTTLRPFQLTLTGSNFLPTGMDAEICDSPLMFVSSTEAHCTIYPIDKPLMKHRIYEVQLLWQGKAAGGDTFKLEFQDPVEEFRLSPKSPLPVNSGLTDNSFSVGNHPTNSCANNVFHLGQPYQVSGEHDSFDPQDANDNLYVVSGDSRDEQFYLFRERAAVQDQGLGMRLRRFTVDASDVSALKVEIIGADEVLQEIPVSDSSSGSCTNLALNVKFTCLVSGTSHRVTIVLHTSFRKKGTRAGSKSYMFVFMKHCDKVDTVSDYNNAFFYFFAAFSLSSFRFSCSLPLNFLSAFLVTCHVLLSFLHPFPFFNCFCSCWMRNSHI